MTYWKDIEEYYPKKGQDLIILWYDTEKAPYENKWESMVINEKYLDSITSPYIYWTQLPKDMHVIL